MSGEIQKRGAAVNFGPRIRLGYETLALNDGLVHTLQHVPNADYGKPELTVVRVRCAANANGGIAWRDDGVAPTAVDGMPAEHLTEEVFNGDPSVLQFIQLTADAVVLHVAYYY